jgi:hypothetical protein
MTRLTKLPLAAFALTALALPAASSLAQSGAAYTIAESGRSFARLQDAVDAVGGGSATIRVGNGRHQDCAVQTMGQIAYIAETPGQAIFDGVTCEGKAALVLRGTSASVAGLVFTNMRVPDFNGAGIRLEHGSLSVSQSWFRDSQQGILTGPDPDGSITVDKSTFTRLGTCEGSGGCAHSIYIGDYGAATVTRSRFEAGRGGHYLKSRAAKIAVLGCSFDDSAGHQTNYMIDLPGGATGRIAGNWFVQGPSKENHSAFIALAAEGKANTSAGLVIEGNDARFAPGVQWPSVFVADWSGDPIQIGANKLDARLTVKERR